MSTDLAHTDHGVRVECLVCGDRLIGDRLDESKVFGDGQGWWVVCQGCLGWLKPDFHIYELRRRARIVRSLGIDVDLRVDGEAL